MSLLVVIYLALREDVIKCPLKLIMDISNLHNVEESIEDIRTFIGLELEFYGPVNTECQVEPVSLTNTLFLE